MTQSAVTVNSGSAAAQGAKSALANEIIDTDEDEMGNDVDLSDNDD